MKIKAKIREVKTNGDTIVFSATGKAVRAPEWMFDDDYEFSVPDTKGTRKAFTLGRNIEIEVKAK